MISWVLRSRVGEISAVLLGDCAEATLAVSDAELGDLRAGVATRTSSLMPNSVR
jgi:hypothetical protein